MARYSRVLFWLLAAVVVVEGFDTNVANIVLPFVGAAFGAGPGELGRGLSLIALGAVAAFFTIRLADRAGRRPVLIGSVIGFSLFSLATAFAQSLEQFVILQFCARIALVTQLTVAYVLLSETLAPEVRGRANGLLAAFASVGAALPAVLLQPAEASGYGWRSLFVLGALPLLVVPVLWRQVREPEAFLARRRAGGRAPSVLGQLALLLAPALRRRFLCVSALWFVINFWVAATMFFFTYYAMRERGWTARDIQLIAPVGLVCAFAGYALAGQLMDAIGRRRTAAALLGLATVATLVCFRAESFLAVAAAWVGLQMLQGIWPVAYTVTSELFPTEVRAAANGLAHNLLGRWGQVLGPAAVGALAEALGSTGRAVAALAFVNLLALPLLKWGLPETKAADLAQPVGLPSA